MCEMHECCVAVPDNMPPCIDSVYLKYTRMHTHAHTQTQTHTHNTHKTRANPNAQMQASGNFVQEYHRERERELARCVVVPDDMPHGRFIHM